MSKVKGVLLRFEYRCISVVMCLCFQYMPHAQYAQMAAATAAYPQAQGQIMQSMQLEVKTTNSIDKPMNLDTRIDEFT